jgi:ABC-type uncharacterized transport system ATPase component
MGDLNTNYKKSTLISIFVLLSVVTAGTATVLNSVNKEPEKEKTKTVAKVEPQVKASTVVQFTAEKDKTVLEQLRTREKVTVKDSQYGPYVDSINGVKGGTDNKYWSFYVDGQMANIGAGEYKTKGGETITWKFE